MKAEGSFCDLCRFAASDWCEVDGRLFKTGEANGHFALFEITGGIAEIKWELPLYAIGNASAMRIYPGEHVVYILDSPVRKYNIETGECTTLESVDFGWGFQRSNTGALVATLLDGTERELVGSDAETFCYVKGDKLYYTVTVTNADEPSYTVYALDRQSGDAVVLLTSPDPIVDLAVTDRYLQLCTLSEAGQTQLYTLDDLTTPLLALPSSVGVIEEGRIFWKPNNIEKEEICCTDLLTKELIWRTEMPESVGRLCAHQNSLYVSGIRPSNAMYAISCDDGAIETVCGK